MRYNAAGPGESGMRSRAALEADLAAAVSRFQKQAFGRGPVETRVALRDGLAVARQRRVQRGEPGRRPVTTAAGAAVDLAEAVQTAGSRRAFDDLRNLDGPNGDTSLLRTFTRRNRLRAS
jgi:hypothetical protein